jgi:heme-degrading monooxygenase HmoA
VFYILWQFRVKKGRRKEFERHYSSNGTWARLFRRAPGFVETILLQNSNALHEYLTIDIWKSKAAHRAFLRRYKKEYEQIDRECERLTSSETLIGKFVKKE